MNLNRNFTKEAVQKFKNNMKVCLTSAIIGEITITMRYQYQFTKMVEIRLIMLSVDEGME